MSEENIYHLNGRVPLGKAIPFGLQHVLATVSYTHLGERCNNIYIILSGKVTGIDWPINERAYSFKDFGPGDFFGEIECFADLLYYRISVVTVTKCRVLTIPAAFYICLLYTSLRNSAK